MKKLGIRLVIKMLDRHTKIKFEDDDSSGAYDHEENTVFIGSECGKKELQVGFQKHIRNKHHYDGAHGSAKLSGRSSTKWVTTSLLTVSTSLSRTKRLLSVLCAQ